MPNEDSTAQNQSPNTNKPIKYHDIIQKLRLMDDEFMAEVFKDTKVCSLVVETILGRHDLEIISAKTHYEIYNYGGRSVELDVLAKDKDGTLYDIELQKDSRGASPKRLRFYSSLIDMRYLGKQKSFEELPEKYIIFITEEDYYEKGKPLYEFAMTSEVDGKPLSLNDGQHFMYVNGSNTSDTPLGRLMQDFHEADPSKMNYDVLKDKVNYYKNTQEGEKHMSDAVKELYNQGRAEGRAEGEAKGIHAMAKYLKKVLPKPEAIKELRSSFGISEADADKALAAA